MRTHYSSLRRPKAAAKILARELAGLSLSGAQALIARTVGYRDWHDLESRHAERTPSLLDQHLEPARMRERLGTVAARLAAELGLPEDAAAAAVGRLRLLGDVDYEDRGARREAPRPTWVGPGSSAWGDEGGVAGSDLGFLLRAQDGRILPSGADSCLFLLPDPRAPGFPKALAEADALVLRSLADTRTDGFLLLDGRNSWRRSGAEAAEAAGGRLLDFQEGEEASATLRWNPLDPAWTCGSADGGGDPRRGWIEAVAEACLPALKAADSRAPHEGHAERMGMLLFADILSAQDEDGGGSDLPRAIESVGRLAAWARSSHMGKGEERMLAALRLAAPGLQDPTAAASRLPVLRGGFGDVEGFAGWWPERCSEILDRLDAALRPLLVISDVLSPEIPTLRPGDFQGGKTFIRVGLSRGGEERRIRRANGGGPGSRSLGDVVGRLALLCAGSAAAKTKGGRERPFGLAVSPLEDWERAHRPDLADWSLQEHGAVSLTLSEGFPAADGDVMAEALPFESGRRAARIRPRAQDLFERSSLAVLGAPDPKIGRLVAAALEGGRPFSRPRPHPAGDLSCGDGFLSPKARRHRLVSLLRTGGAGL